MNTQVNVTRTPDQTGVILTGEAFSLRPSSAIKDYEFNEKNQTLVLTYVGGRRYQYFNVTKTVVEDFIKSDSKGEFVNTQIKPNYKFEAL